jgi:hypothetical protein
MCGREILSDMTGENGLKRSELLMLYAACLAEQIGGAQSMVIQGVERFNNRSFRK